MERREEQKVQRRYIRQEVNGGVTNMGYLRYGPHVILPNGEKNIDLMDDFDKTQEPL